MKYLKTYESDWKLHEDSPYLTAPSYKQYLIMEHTYRPNRLFIYNVVSLSTSKLDTIVTMRRLFEYNTKTLKLTQDVDYYYFKASDITSSILYQTDSLEDAKNTLETITDANKYNI